MPSTDWVTQEYYFSNTHPPSVGFFFSSSSPPPPRCFVQWSKFLEEERGSELKKRRSSARWIWRLLCLVPARANICKRQACFDYTSPTQIECCHARMRYFSTLPVIKVRTDKWTHAHMHMDACSHMVFFFSFSPLLIWMHASKVAPCKVTPVIVKSTWRHHLRFERRLRFY